MASATQQPSAMVVANPALIQLQQPQEMTTAKEQGKLGPLIRLSGIRTNQLPPVEGGRGPGDCNLAWFLASLLREAVPFIESVAPKGDAKRDEKKREWKPKGVKSYRESAADVELFERVIGAGELEMVKKQQKEGGLSLDSKGVSGEGGGETWVCRRSVHEDARETLTASWEEFRDCFKDRHAETEKMFTPSVVKMEKVVVWDCAGVPPQRIAGETWHNFTLCVLEARHHIGKPLKDRTFPILQMTCSIIEDNNDKKEKPEFLIISLTVPDWFTSSTSVLQTHREGNDDSDKGTVIASYASIERFRKLPTPSSPTTSKEESSRRDKIEWLMALTSDASGVLPRWVQNLALPGQIAKDVSLFLGWIVKERTKTSSGLHSEAEQV
ncbi:hypothetical protein B0H66DRAFT_59518 [Apodospora peruviana]|uniref:DUF3074 domain-containing protein n=1 Tax=Apodospora peruviana TaxID=516989 RepID=A0AAE0MFB1_9PEZI|nr:hypothetical protein B0H66DRAFT_59518 [Apodospora peruviana]